MPETPKVSVVVPCYNEERTIGHLLTALRDQTFPADQFETVIADGISSDSTRQVIADFADDNPAMRITIVDNPRRNIPSALNLAITRSLGAIILRLDAHAIPADNYIALCVGALEAGLGENVGGLWQIRPQTDTLIARSIALAAAHPLGVGDARYRYSSRPGLVDTVPFGCFTRATLDTIGGYDETLLTNEDYELNTRIRLNGGRVYFDPEIKAIYFSRSSLMGLARQYWRYGFWKFKMLKRYPHSLRARQALPPLFVISMLLLLGSSLCWHPAAIAFIALFGVYFLTLMVAAIPSATRERESMFIFSIPLAIMTMHTAWGAGFLYSPLSSLFQDR